MQNFMPSTQPRGTHSFDPCSSSTQSVQMLNTVNAEEDGAEDQDGPPVDISLDNIAGTSSFPSVTSNLDILGLGARPSVASGSSLSLPPDISSSGGTRPPSSSSLPPSAHPHSTQRRDISMGSVLSHNTDTSSDPGNTQLRKRKHDGQSAGGTDAGPTSSKRSTRSKASDLNPVIISNALNSTLNRLADVMEKTLDTTATAMAPAAAAPPTSATPPTSLSSILTSSTQPISNPPSTSSRNILNQAIEIAASDNTLTEDELLAASLFFTSATEEAIRVASGFIAISNGRGVLLQRRFLLGQPGVTALLPGKGKGKAVEDVDDSMTY
jgi:hypothetical protein